MLSRSGRFWWERKMQVAWYDDRRRDANRMMWLIVACFLGFILLTKCASFRMPHEIFGWKRPENLMTICHVWDKKTQKTMSFNTSMAKRHLKHDKADYLGECQ